MAILSREERLTLLMAAEMVPVDAYHPMGVRGTSMISLLRFIAGPDHDTDNAASLAETAAALSPVDEVC